MLTWSWDTIIIKHHKIIEKESQNMSLTVMSFIAPEEKIHLIADHWDGESQLSVSYFEQNPKEGLWSFEVTLDDHHDHDFLEKTFKEMCQKLEISGSLTWKKLPETDWLSLNRQDFPPIHVEPFYIYGSHIQDPIPENTIPFLIDASTAFGTGSHPTTQGCLRLLWSLKKQGLDFKHILDMGTGTGILAMAAARVFPQSQVIATDYDPEAVNRAERNILENSLIDQISSMCVDGVQDPNFQDDFFDLLMANILAGPLIHLARDICRIIKPGGHLILSGILNNLAPEVIQAYTPWGCVIETQEDIDDWSTILMRKIG